MVKLNKQTSLAVFAVVFATAMIVGTFASASDNMAFATHGKKAKNVKSQSNSNSQSTNCAANGGPATGTGFGGLGIGAGVGASVNLGLNLCPNTNTNSNVDTAAQTAQIDQQ